MLSQEEVKAINEKNKNRRVEFLEIKSLEGLFKCDIIVKTTYIDERKKSLCNKGDLNPIVKKGFLQITIPEWDDFSLVIKKERNSIIIFESNGTERSINLKGKEEFALGIYLD